MAKEDQSLDVFISYSSRDREKVLEIADRLQSAGLRLWVDRNKIPGGANYGVEIVRGIKDCKVLLLMASASSMRSRNVKAEIQLAWRYERPYLPLLLEPMKQFPEQVEYWLEGWQWIEVLDQPPELWFPQVLEALAYAGIRISDVPGASSLQSVTKPTRLVHALDGLHSLASFTDQIWPVPADRVERGSTRSIMRDLGALQDDVQHGYRLGSRVSLAIESDREGHLLLLNEGTSGKIYCLCPSSFAPDTRLHAGRGYLPQEGSRFDSFVVTGKPGREQLLAIITDEPLGFDWLPSDPKSPARILDQDDIDALLERLQGLEGDRWIALSTFFDVIA